MKIVIDYDSSWRNSFLDGSNDEELPKKGRNFVASMTEGKKEGNYIPREITHNTVAGILNRLIGDQRKLYQSRRNQESYYFQDIEPLIEFSDDPTTTNEITYIRNMKGSEDQNSFTGMIKTNDPIFCADYSKSFWGVLALDFNGLCSFIVDETPVVASISLDPISIINRLENLNKEKPVVNEGMVARVIDILKMKFPDDEYLDSKGMVKPVMIYCAGLYIQLNRLGNRYDMISAKTRTGGIGGISKRGFTKKDFMGRYTTGKKKKIWGNPYIMKVRKKGEGEVVSMLTKASGRLEINIDIDETKALELKNMIDCAGVSSFYLGKKGLAYVSQIRV